MSKQPANQEPVPPAKNAADVALKPKTNWGFQKILLGLALGILIGYLFTQRVTDFLPSILPALMAVFIALFLFIIIAVLALPRIINYLAKRYTGQKVDVEAAVGDIQAKANHIADTIAGYALAKADPEVRKNIRQDLPGILHYLVFSRLRNSGLRMLMTVFVAIGGLMGTILLYNQNQLLQKQNEKIDNQILLDEAARRSSLNFLLGNVLDQVNQELSDTTNKKRELSPQLIGRIASLSQSFQPYYFMEDGKMIGRPLSPERGALLLALVNSGIDTLSLDMIFQKTIFSNAHLQNAILDLSYLRKINLRNSNLRNASLIITDLSEADLYMADFDGTNLVGANLIRARLKDANFRNAILSATDFRESDLQGANFHGTNLWGLNFSNAKLRDAKLSSTKLNKTNFSLAYMQDVDISNADLSGANFSGSDLSGANFKGADLNMTNFSKADLYMANFSMCKNLTYNSLDSCFSIYQVQNLPDSLEILLKAKIMKKPQY